VCPVLYQLLAILQKIRVFFSDLFHRRLQFSTNIPFSVGLSKFSRGALPSLISSSLGHSRTVRNPVLVHS
jgi:hypothetical protein